MEQNKLQSPAQVQPVSKLPADGNFELALKGTKIIVSDTEQIKEVLRLVMIKLGLRAQNWPTDEEKLVLIHHIIKEFGGHTCEEIKLAFDMAISGKLDAEVNCYENFSCLYFSNIMIAYREYSREQINHVKKEVKELPPPNEPEMSDDEFLEMNKNIWKGSRLFGLISVKCYSILTKRGLINLPPEQKDVILKKARANFFGPENKENRDGLRFEQQENYITMDAKKIAVAEYFNEN